jgi:hypothetical protein
MKLKLKQINRQQKIWKLYKKNLPKLKQKKLERLTKNAKHFLFQKLGIFCFKSLAFFVSNNIYVSNALHFLLGFIVVFF